MSGCMGMYGDVRDSESADVQAAIQTDCGITGPRNRHTVAVPICQTITHLQCEDRLTGRISPTNQSSVPSGVQALPNSSPALCHICNQPTVKLSPCVTVRFLYASSVLMWYEITVLYRLASATSRQRSSLVPRLGLDTL